MAEEVYTKLERFVCQLYGKASRDVGDLRYKLFCTKGLQSQQLPPTRHALRKHIRRANYQTAIWKRSLESHPEISSSSENGWKIANEQLKIDWNDLPLAPIQCWNFLVVHAIKNMQITDVRVLIMDCHVRTYAIVVCTDVCENKQDSTMEESDPEDEED